MPHHHDHDLFAIRSVLNETAEAARSILARPEGAELAVDGILQPLDGLPESVCDWSGVPVIVCEPGGRVSQGGEARSEAVLSLRGGVLPEDGSLSLVGRLRHAGEDFCPCCGRLREHVLVDLTAVVLERGGVQVEIDVEEFADPALELNSGYLRCSADHLNAHHGEHLREGVAWRTTEHLDAIAAAQVASLSPSGVELRYVTVEGAHVLPLEFPEAARSAEELADRVRWAVHPDLC